MIPGLIPMPKDFPSDVRVRGESPTVDLRFVTNYDKSSRT